MSDSSGASDAIQTKEQCKYCACFCEENVYWLIKELRQRHPESKLWAIVCTTPNGVCLDQEAANSGGPSNGGVALFMQSQGMHESGGMVVWDYHVFVRELGENRDLVYDLDSMLGFPTETAAYVFATFRPDISLSLDGGKWPKRYFKCIDGDCYLSRFSSDRSHMMRAEGGWLAAPPSWSPIRGEASNTDNDLKDILVTSAEMKEGTHVMGEIHDEQGFIAWARVGG